MGRRPLRGGRVEWQRRASGRHALRLRVRALPAVAALFCRDGARGPKAAAVVAKHVRSRDENAVAAASPVATAAIHRLVARRLLRLRPLRNDLVREVAAWEGRGGSRGSAAEDVVGAALAASASADAAGCSNIIIGGPAERGRGAGAGGRREALGADFRKTLEEAC